MLGKVALESLMAVGYAAFVALGAIAFEAVARQSQRRHEPADVGVGRLRRAVEVAVVGFGGLVILASAVLNHSSADLAVLAAGFAFLMAVAVFLMADIHPAPRDIRWSERRDSPRVPTTSRPRA
jgi:hypothetical protein